MESIIVEFARDDTPSWLEEMVDEFTEDPFCTGVLVGADDKAVFFISLWASAVAEDVAANLTGLSPVTASVRRIVLSVPAQTEPGLSS